MRTFGPWRRVWGEDHDTVDKRMGSVRLPKGLNLLE